MTRYVLLAFLGLGASISWADMGMLPDGAQLKFNKVLLHEHNAEVPAEPEIDPDSLLFYFNSAHCECSFFNYNPETADMTFFENNVAFELTVEGGSTPVTDPIEIWTGTGCDTNDTTQRAADCHKVDSAGAGTVAAIQQSGAATISVPIFDVMVPKASERPGCKEREQDGTVWALVDVGGTGMTNYSVSKTLKTDTKPPPLPTNFHAVGAENAVVITWDSPAEGVSDVAYYQALCATAGGAPAKSNPPKARYQTSRQLCGAPSDVFLTPSDISSNTGTDAGSGSIVLTEEMAQLQPAFICGESASATKNELRIDGLKNGSEYTVILLTIDRSGNATGTFFTSPLVPQPATDFWEDLHDQGSGVEGGFCLLAQTFGDDNPLTNTLRSFRDNTLADTAYGRWLIDVYYGTIGALDLHGSVALRIVAGVLLLPLVVLALLWHLLTLPGLLALAALLVLIRKRRFAQARLAAVTTVAFVALFPARAHAQSPYWETQEYTNTEAELPPGDPMRVRWHAGIRLGPYVPGIDDQVNMPVGKFAGPYEQMFGGSSVLPVLDVDYFLWRGFGQLGVGASLGYLGKKAHAWQAGSDPADPKRPRAEGDENKFRLFPFSLNVVYRFTYLDDEYGVPIVPYARGGLAYYIWWITAPNGDFSKSCVGPNTGAMCQTTTAAGASLGVVGSVGLAVRAERVDEGAARSMRESGIEHAGFYAEYSIGKVDGFGSDKKLSVGDATWFAGVDFEF
ncbi:MAG TPA: MXAN_2562 family outer membrane beta-barrel protein [Kofleriaceae bacterium]|nr:MXAN_2562 family outer membrane beta-barrel protein [Kofleriaceae bacterium]